VSRLSWTPWRHGVKSRPLSFFDQVTYDHVSPPTTDTHALCNAFRPLPACKKEKSPFCGFPGENPALGRGPPSVWQVY